MYIYICIHTKKMTCHLSLPSIWRSISCLTSMINSARQAQVRNKFQHPSRRANYILMTDRVLQNPDYTPEVVQNEIAVISTPPSGTFTIHIPFHHA